MTEHKEGAGPSNQHHHRRANHKSNHSNGCGLSSGPKRTTTANTNDKNNQSNGGSQQADSRCWKIRLGCLIVVTEHTRVGEGTFIRGKALVAGRLLSRIEATEFPAAGGGGCSTIRLSSVVKHGQAPTMVPGKKQSETPLDALRRPETP